MVETISTDKFNADMLKAGSNIGKDLIKTAGADDKWVKVAEFVDHSITQVVEAIKDKNRLQSQNPQLNQGIQNPQGLATVQNISAANGNMPMAKEPQIAWKIPQALQDLRQYLKEHEADMPMEKTLREILENEEYNALLNLNLTQQKIANFINKYIQLIWT